MLTAFLQGNFSHDVEPGLEIGPQPDVRRPCEGLAAIAPESGGACGSPVRYVVASPGRFAYALGARWPEHRSSTSLRACSTADARVERTSTDGGSGQRPRTAARPRYPPPPSTRLEPSCRASTRLHGLQPLLHRRGPRRHAPRRSGVIAIRVPRRRRIVALREAVGHQPRCQRSRPLARRGGTWEPARVDRLVHRGRWSLPVQDRSTAMPAAMCPGCRAISCGRFAHQHGSAIRSQLGPGSRTGPAAAHTSAIRWNGPRTWCALRGRVRRRMDAGDARRPPTASWRGGPSGSQGK